MLNLTYGERLGIITACTTFLLIVIICLVCKAIKRYNRYCPFTKYYTPPPKSRTVTTYEGPNITTSAKKYDRSTHQISPESMSLNLKSNLLERRTSETDSEGSPFSPAHSSVSVSTSASNLGSPNDTYSSLQFNVQRINGTGKYGSGLHGSQHHMPVGQLEPELRHRLDPTFLNSSSETIARGSVQFSLCYDQYTGHLLIMLFQVKDLPPTDFSGTSDPYVKIKILKNTHRGTDLTTEYDFQSKVLRKTLDPVFDEKFEVSMPYNDLDNCAVKFIACDFDRFSRHNIIGEAMLPLKGIELSKEQVLWLDFKESKQEYRGELLLSLSYLPTSERLSIVLMKAKNLQPNAATSQHCDPYVKVILVHNGKKVKRKKSSVQKGERNPIFNETMAFDIPMDEMDKITFIVSICNRHLSDTDSDSIGRQSEVIGQTVLGAGVSPIAHDHWMEMLRSPRKQVAQWYTLKE
ncbi:synaptotagmin-1-like isoform X2 [Ptychodera flava]